MKRLIFFFGIGLFIAMNTGHAAKIYKWRGPDGQIHYSSTPPPEANAESTGVNTTTRQPEQKNEEELNLDGMSDEEKIRALEDKLNKEKIRALEEQLKEVRGGKAGKDSGDSRSGKSKASDEEVVMPEEDAGPDYSVQGQIRMLEKTKQIEKMKTRCRAKASHGVDCDNPENYQNY